MHAGLHCCLLLCTNMSTICYAWCWYYGPSAQAVRSVGPTAGLCPCKAMVMPISIIYIYIYAFWWFNCFATKVYSKRRLNAEEDARHRARCHKLRGKIRDPAQRARVLDCQKRRFNERAALEPPGSHVHILHGIRVPRADVNSTVTRYDMVYVWLVYIYRMRPHNSIESDHSNMQANDSTWLYMFIKQTILLYENMQFICI